jgi:hypothetical protein
LPSFFAQPVKIAAKRNADKNILPVFFMFLKFYLSLIQNNKRIKWIIISSY